MACFSSGWAASCSRQSLARAMAWSANYTPTAPRRGLGELGVSGVNRDALVGHQPGQHTSTNRDRLVGSQRREILHRVHRFVADADLEVQVRARGPARRSLPTDSLTTRHLLADGDIGLEQVTVQGHDAAAVGDDDVIAVADA